MTTARHHHHGSLPGPGEERAPTEGASVIEQLRRARLETEALRASQARLELAVQGSSDGIWDWDIVSGDLFVSDRWCELLGYRREEITLTPATWLDLVHPDERPNFIERLRRHREEKEPLEIEARLRMKSGEFRFFLTRGRAVWDEAGQAIRLAGSLTDLSVLKHADEAVRKSAERFQKLALCSSVGIFETDEHGAVIFVSQQFCELSGVQPPDVVGKSYLETVLPEDRPQVEAAWSSMVLRGRVLEIDYRTRAGGRAEAVLVTAAGIRDAQGKVTGFVGTIADLTEQRKLQTRIRLSDRMISLGTLAAGVAHEINNPLAFIVANLAFAIDELGRPAGPRIPVVVDALKDAGVGGERIQRIVRDMKTFSRGGDAPPTTIDLEQVLESCLSMANNEIRHRAVLTRNLSGQLRVEGSETQLSQVFLNLLVNAAQAIPEGRSDLHRIDVITRREEDRAVVLIHDTGAGIAPENLSRIFDPFFTTKPVGVGTGLGLPIAYGIISAMHGDISVESVVGVGTTFRVSLPLSKGLVAAPPPADDEVGARHARILVIDDEPLLLNALERTLSRRHEVVTLTSANAALARITAGEHFDSILCDLMMPGLSGSALHAELTRVAPAQARRMVFMTGGAFTEAAQQFLARVPNLRLEKPFTPRELEQTLLRCLADPTPAATVAVSATVQSDTIGP